jgi:large subunit ribosomal protein L19
MRSLQLLLRASAGFRELLTTPALATGRMLSSSQRFATVSAPTRRRLRDRHVTAPYSEPGERPVYPKRKSPFKRCQALIDALHDEETARLVASGRAVMPARVPGLRSGDIVRVAYVSDQSKEQCQYFTGLCIAVKNRGTGSSFVLRNVVDGVAVERSWPTYTPLIREAEIIGRKKVRRNKLWYLRDKPLRDSTFGDATRRPKPSA